MGKDGIKHIYTSKGKPQPIIVIIIIQFNPLFINVPNSTAKGQYNNNNVRGCTRQDRFKNKSIRKELGVESIMQKVISYREKWKLHRARMADERIPKQMMKYQPRGYRSIGYPRKRWMEM
jgi:hypothetical protein